MPRHPFRVAIESGARSEELRALFAPNASLLAPMLTKPLRGADRALEVVVEAARVAGPIEYMLEASDPRQTILLWKGTAGGFPLEAATILVDGTDGLIDEVRVLMRPWPVVTIFREQMHERLGRSISAEYWELGPRGEHIGNDRPLSPIALRPVDPAPDMVLHSPMLARSVSGKAEVAAAVGLAHEVQSKSSYTSIIATPEVLIELFDCDADGYPMEGLWVQNLNSEGKISELRVLLRPYPAVTVLRNMTRALAEQNNFLAEPEYWELKDPPVE
jgi:hypothetical protein